MVEIKHVIEDKLGLHARPAGQLVKVVTAFKCKMQIGTAAKMVDAKSILGVMALALKQGDTLVMSFDGEDEAEAAEAVTAFLQENL